MKETVDAAAMARPARQVELKVDAGAKFRFMRWYTRDRERLNETDIRVLNVLTDMFNVTKGRAWPSLTTLAKETGSGRRNVARSIIKLDKLGIVHRISGGARRTGNNYIPNFGLADEASDIAGASASIGTRLVPQLWHQTSASAEAPYTSNPRSISVGGEEVAAPAAAAAPGGAAASVASPSTSALASSTSALAANFERFWLAYPKKEGRKQAVTAYALVTAKGVGPALLQSKAMQYFLAVAHKNPQYIKMPANWLRDEGWLEDPQPPRPKGSPPGTAKVRDKRTSEVGTRRRGAKRRSGPRRANERRAPAPAKPTAAQRQVRSGAAQRQVKRMAPVKPTAAQRQAVLETATPKTPQELEQLYSRAWPIVGSAVIEKIIKTYAPRKSEIPKDKFPDVARDIKDAVTGKNQYVSTVLD